MLVLTRKFGKSIIIGEGESQIKVKLLGQRDASQGLRIGIEAPRHVTILREELVYRRARQSEEVARQEPVPAGVEFALGL